MVVSRCSLRCFSSFLRDVSMFSIHSKFCLIVAKSCGLSTKHELKNLKVAVLDMYIVKDGASFCCCAYVLRISGYSGFLRNNLPNTTIYFCAVYDYVEKVVVSKGYQNPKRKLGVTTHFSEIVELKFGKKLPYILCT